MRYLWTAIPFSLSVIISYILQKLLGNGEKIDRGFVVCFWKLSYRRKFIRTLWLLPIIVIEIYYIHIIFESYLLTVFIGVILSILFVVQSAYYYKKWKAEN